MKAAPLNIVYSLLVGFLCNSGSVSAEIPQSNVFKLNKSTFDEFVKSSTPNLVEFFAPWCGHCKQLAPEYEIAATALKGYGVKLGSVDCTEDTNKAICESHKIRGYPTLKVFRSGEASDYDGGRKSDDIIKYMKKQLAPAVSFLEDFSSLAKFKESDEVVVVGFFNRNSEEAKEFMKVASDLRNEFSFGLYEGEEGKKDTVSIFKRLDKSEEAFAEKLVAENLKNFIKKNSLPLVDDIGPANYMKYMDSGLPLSYFFYSDAAERAKFHDAVVEAAKMLKGKVNTVFIDASAYGAHADVLNVEKKWPAFVIHNMETEQKYPFPSTEQLSKESLVDFVTKYLGGKVDAVYKSEPVPADDPTVALKTIVHRNFLNVVMDKSKDVLVKLYADWCGACKRLAPEYEELAKNIAGLSEKLVIAKFNAINNDLPPEAKIKLEHFPTLVLYKAETNELVKYDGGLSYNDLAEFLETHAHHKIKIERKEAAAPPAEEISSEEGEEHEHEHEDEEPEHEDL